MGLFFKSLFRHSELMHDDVFESTCTNGKVLERNELGPKVIQLENGDILKVFRVKHLISGARIYSYARRFCRNAARLEAIGIPTVKIKKLYRFSDTNKSAVLYEPLAGQTLRQIVDSHADSTRMNCLSPESMALFLSKLHEHGVHFHSLHTGNIVVDNSGGLGLIDMSDLSIYPWPLFCKTRVRSFKRLCRYPEEVKRFGEDFWLACLQKYFAQSDLGMRCQARIRSGFRQLTGMIRL